MISLLPALVTFVTCLVFFIPNSIAVPYAQYILAPPSRILHPVSVFRVNGTVSNAESLTKSATKSAIFQNVSAVTLDYGKNIGGLVSLTIGNSSDWDQFIGITFTESSLWISVEGCDATADSGIDEALWFQPSAPGVYTVAREHERGAFRYLSLVHNTTGNLEVTQVTTYFTPMPHYADNALRSYTGYFHSNDELINRIWYAGAYTNQLCTIDPTHGDALVHFGSTSNVTGPVTWYNNYTITNGSSALVDGAKRDRLVWPGDMSIAVPSIAVSTNDLITIRNSLDSLFVLQGSNGQLPYAGTPLGEEFGTFYSFTYHLYTLIGVTNYYLYTSDSEWLAGKWEQYKLALNLSLSTIDDSGLMYVTSSADWLRFGMGGHNIEANAILYHTIGLSINLANILNDTSVIPAWEAAAIGVKTAANNILWDSSVGLYRDNETTTLHPQDGNAWAVVSNITLNSTQIDSISSELVTRWTPYGAPAPEADDAISPFVSGFELQAHVLANNASAALDLIRLQWGFMLDDPRMTNSTFIEGYSSDGSLHYAPYSNDPRVSHAHGWATGPTSLLTFFISGIKLTSAGGRTWAFEPRPGSLKSIDAGFLAVSGSFSSKIEVAETEAFMMRFEAPKETTGTMSIVAPECPGTLTLAHGKTVKKVTTSGPKTVDFDGLDGGVWNVDFTCHS